MTLLLWSAVMPGAVAVVRRLGRAGGMLSWRFLDVVTRGEFGPMCTR